MAVKVFCNQCQNFIKDVEPREISKLNGNEICTACKEKNKVTFSDIEAIRNEGIGKLKAIASEYLAKLDEAMRQEIK